NHRVGDRRPVQQNGVALTIRQGGETLQVDRDDPDVGRAQVVQHDAIRAVPGDEVQLLDVVQVQSGGVVVGERGVVAEGGHGDRLVKSVDGEEQPVRGAGAAIDGVRSVADVPQDDVVALAAE